MAKYYSNNPSITNEDAKVIGRYLEKKFGKQVTPLKVLEAAKDKSCPLHKYFEWDDRLAAQNYRLDQARKIITSVYVTADDGKLIRNYLRVKLDDGPTYLNYQSVGESQDLVEQVIAQAQEQLIRWKERYGRYVDYFQFTIHTKGKEYVVKKEENRKAN